MFERTRRGAQLESDAAQPQGKDVAQPMERDLVVALPSRRSDGYQAGIQQHPEMAGGGRPGVGESGGELPRRQSAVSGSQHLEDVTASWMSQRPEHDIDVLEIA
jgi:hypothetical protein